MRSSVLALLSLGTLALASMACGNTSGDGEGDTSDSAINVAAARGIATMHFPAATAGAPDEICVVPKHIPNAGYDSGDEKSEKELCSYALSGAPARESGAPYTDTAICPKIDSTNPGTDVFELGTNQTRQQTQAAICGLQDKPTKHLAKFKSSITCSYTPSILGYYHLSRALGGAGNVKPAVLRTMDVGAHKQVVASALNIIHVPDTAPPRFGWIYWRDAEKNVAVSRYKDADFTPDLLQIYGGLQENARGEDRYAGMNLGGVTAFEGTAAWQRMLNPTPATQIGGSTLASAAQPIIQMSDISEMIVLDYLMNQQDRFGNIHDVDTYYFLNNGKLDHTKKSKIDDMPVGQRNPPAGAVLVKKMILKDNDCGGYGKTPVARTAGLLAAMRHMNPKVYKHLRWLAANFAPNGAIPVVFSNEALFAQADIDMMRTNLATAAQTVYQNCKSGKLLLDVNLEDVLAGRHHDPAACEASEAPSP